ncbi:MAG: SH3 domain-containing protein, partial [Actinomycetia bacterium]|nr:SH3 domain-containing protein [Actinomycetes bacterium]
MELWYPPAVVNKARRTGGAFDPSFPRRGVLHTTESPGFTPSLTDYGGWHSFYPHFTIVAGPPGVAIYQHIAIDTAARALKGTTLTETNKAGAIQIEIVGRAAESATFSDELIEALASWMRWVEAEAGVVRTAPHRFLGSEAFGFSGAARMTIDQWERYNGWCGHQHVPRNDHWDPGRIDIDRLLSLDPGPPAPRLLMVIGVADNDVLNVRAEPDASSPIVYTLPPTADEVVATGPVRHVEGQVWLQVETPSDPGWANATFLLEYTVDPEPGRYRVRRVAADDRLNLRR